MVVESTTALDYPPFFAYFEFLLSLPARLIDRRIVELSNLNYGEWSVVAYQRTTVIITELVLGAALLRCAVFLPSLQRFCHNGSGFRLSRGSLDRSTQRIIACSLFLHPGFIIVDHIHFQYNGFLFGILVWSLVMAREVGSAVVAVQHILPITERTLQGKQLLSGVLFAVLLNFKHIFMYLAVSASVHSSPAASHIFFVPIKARLFHISFACLLHPYLRKADRAPAVEIYLPRKRCRRHICAFIWAVCFSQNTGGVLG